MNAPAPRFTPADAGFALRVLESFNRQKAMRHIGATISTIEPGYCEIELPFRDELTQQKGFVHGGIVGMIADSACGYAAYSLMPATSSLVTVEYKINILAPAKAGLLKACGSVIKPGRTLTITRSEVYAGDTLVAAMQQTLMQLVNTPDTQVSETPDTKE
jgi:uncharacterized protein (TIGR00369 family)